MGYDDIDIKGEIETDKGMRNRKTGNRKYLKSYVLYSLF